MAFPDALWVNGRSSAPFKLLLSDPVGFYGPIPVSDQRIAIPGRQGQLPLRQSGESQVRRFTVGGVLRADTEAEFLTLWPSFMRLLGSGDLELRFARYPTMVGIARLESVSPTESGIRNGMAFTLTFVMANPLKYGLQEDTYATTDGVPVALALGNAPSDLHLMLTGNDNVSSTVTVYYRDARGVIQSEVNFVVDPNLPAGNWINYNWDGYQLATLTVKSGVVTTLAPTGTRLIGVADPNDGDATTGPTLTPVNCNLFCQVTPCWL